MSKPAFYILISLLVLLVSFPASAATLQGHAYNKNTDQPLAGVQVVIQNTDRSGVTDQNGYFEFSDLDGGIYDLLATKSGYEADEIKRFRVGSNQTLAVEFRLKPESRDESGRSAKPVMRTGVLRGQVTSKENGETLPGTTIRIDELAMAASSGRQGNYLISGIKPGRYTVEAMEIGYIQVKHYEIEIYAGDTTALDFQLQPTVLPLGTEVVVYGIRPLMDPTVPAAIRSIDPGELQRGPVRNLTDILKDLPGVVEVDDELHIRGGRTYETQFLVDGVPVTDPLIRKGLGHSLNANAIKGLTLYSGGADAEFYGATSGVVEIQTREGHADYTGSAVYRNDHFLGSSGFNTDQLELTLSGPEKATSSLFKSMGLPGQTYFFGSGNFLLTDTYLPYSRHLYSTTFSGTSLAPRSDNEYSTLLKWSWQLTPLVKLSFAHSAAATVNQDRSILETRLKTIDYSYGYPYEYEKTLDSYDTFTKKSNQQTLILDYKPSTNKQVNITAARFFTTLHADVKGKNWADYVQPVDTLPNIFEISEDSSYYTISQGDGFWDSGDGDTWYDHYIENYSLKATYQTNLQSNFSSKMGLESELQTIQVLDIYKPWLSESGFGLSYDAYRAKPANFGAFVQNNLNLQGMIFDFGVRYDLWFPGKYAEDALANDSISPLSQAIRNDFEQKTMEVFGRRAHGIISPRFGISNLLTRNLSLYGSYSRFARRPPPQFLYAKLYTPSQSAYQLFGNPGLDFEKVTNIEVGMKYLPNPSTAIGISAYLKSIQDYIAATLISPDPRFPDESYFIYFNLDYATSQGVELEYFQNLSEVVKFSANCAFSKAKGEHSLPNDILRGIQSRSEGAIYNEILFDWDKPWQFVMKLDVEAPRDRTIKFLGVSLPRDWNLGIKFWGQAGKRYTPYEETTDEFGFKVFKATQSINSKIGPWWNSLDVSLQKIFRLGKIDLTFYLEGTNILNHKNVTLINPLTGDVYKEGDVIPTGGNLFELPPPSYQLPLWNNPTRYLSPRELKTGIGVSF